LRNFPFQHEWRAAVGAAVFGFILFVFMSGILTQSRFDYVALVRQNDEVPIIEK
jgi:hypothetical protein